MEDGACLLALRPRHHARHGRDWPDTAGHGILPTPTVQLNFQILLLCPLNLVYLFPTVRALRKGKSHPYVKLYILLLAANLMLAFFQTYAEGMVVLAVSLLMRYGWLMIHTHGKTTKDE